MLGLQLATDPRWVTIVESNIEEILTDHAWCEQKAASNAISLITQNPEKEELVTELLVIAREELEHLQMVHAGHYSTFLNFARKYTEKVDVDKRWKEWIVFETSIITNYGKKETVHG